MGSRYLPRILQTLLFTFRKCENITVNSDSVIPKEKNNVSEKDQQAIPYGKNEANKSIEEIPRKNWTKREQIFWFRDLTQQYVIIIKLTDQSL